MALALPNFYSASALLAPADQSTGSLSGMMQRVGGIASLAGISLPSGDEGNKVQLGIELMTSRSFIGNFVERRNLLPDLMAFESWDMSTGEIEYDSDIYDIDENKWVRDVSLPYKPKPSVLEAHEQFMSWLQATNLRVHSSSKNTETLTIEQRCVIVCNSQFRLAFHSSGIKAWRLRYLNARCWRKPCGGWCAADRAAPFSANLDRADRWLPRSSRRRRTPQPWLAR